MTEPSRPGKELSGEYPIAEVSLVPAEGVFEGQVAIAGRTRIDGTVLGSLRGPGELILGPESRIEGVIECDRVVCRGHVTGPISAVQRADLGAGTRFEGDLETALLEVHDDAIWIGRARVGL